MKTLFLKNGMPVATAVLAIAGAFATTSMQSSSGAFAQQVGYTLDFNGECDIAVICSDIPAPNICRLSYPAGTQVFKKSSITGNCSQVLYRWPAGQ